MIVVHRDVPGRPGLMLPFAFTFLPFQHTVSTSHLARQLSCSGRSRHIPLHSAMSGVGNGINAQAGPSRSLGQAFTASQPAAVCFPLMSATDISPRIDESGERLAKRARIKRSSKACRSVSGFVWSGETVTNAPVPVKEAQVRRGRARSLPKLYRSRRDV